MSKKDIKITSLTAGANLRAILMSFAGLLLMATFAPCGLTHAQYCNPAVVSYIVRDEKGKVLTETELKSVHEQLPKLIGDAQTYAGDISFADDGKTFYWGDAVDWPKGKKVPSLQFINSGTCTMHLTEATLTYHNKTMRLIFNVEITREQHDRRPVIDSLPFQEGTFALDLNGWSHDPYKVITPERWKKVKDPARGRK